MKRVFNNVEPFNDFALRDCFFSALFPAINALGGDSNATAILAGSDMYFSYDDSNLNLHKEKIDDDELKEWLKDQNIEIVFNYEEQCNIVECVKGVIDHNKLPMVSLVDPCSYDPITKRKTEDTAGFKHWVLFYGYDDSHKEFYVIDHFYIASPIYCKLRMKYKDLEESYQSVNKKYNSKIFMLKLLDEKNGEDLYKKYFDVWKNKKKFQNKDNSPIDKYMDYVISVFYKLENSMEKKILLSFIETFYWIMVYYIKENYIVKTLYTKNFLDMMIYKDINKLIVYINTFRTMLFSLMKSGANNSNNAEYIELLLKIKDLSNSIEKQLTENVKSFEKEESGDAK